MPIVALLVLALAASPKAPSPLAKCEATPLDDGWQYDCGDVVALVQDRSEVGERARKSLDAMVQAAPATVGEGAKTRSEKGELLGRDVELFITEAPGNPDAKYHAAMSYEAGTRFLLCHGGSDRCVRVIAALAAAPWRGANVPGSIRKDAPPFAIAGRAVKVPAGCERKVQPNGGGVVCAKTNWVVWVAVDEASAPRVVASNGDNMRKTLDRPGWKRKETEVPCRLAGARTTCTRLLAESGKDALVVQWALAPAGDGHVFASCMGLGTKPGSACALVFDAP